MNDYRAHIYANYVAVADELAVPKSVQDFAPRLPSLNYVIQHFFPENKNAKILDLGCGHGALVYAAQLAGYQNVKGIDVSQQQVELAHKLGINSVTEGDLMKALNQAEPASYDAIISFDVIEHFKPDELLAFVAAVFKALKAGGRWIIHTPNAESPFVGAIRYGDFTHCLAFTRGSLQQLLMTMGFNKVECFECAPIRHGFKSSVRWFLWRLIHNFWRFYTAVETGDTAAKAVFTRNLYCVAYKRS
ncbi:MAG TPA: class I SAM-dependent methyltransferase [Coxiellaceae bacterium]|nr:class I SAM-dependent methyltransferase [Coxiellaceae bacterium]